MVCSICKATIKVRAIHVVSTFLVNRMHTLQHARLRDIIRCPAWDPCFKPNLKVHDPNRKFMQGNDDLLAGGSAAIPSIVVALRKVQIVVA